MCSTLISRVYPLLSTVVVTTDWQTLPVSQKEERLKEKEGWDPLSLYQGANLTTGKTRGILPFTSVPKSRWSYGHTKNRAGCFAAPHKKVNHQLMMLLEPTRSNIYPHTPYFL
jgi:hypothetical protein